MQLEKETVRRMAECFSRQTCCCCGRPAERLSHHRFYCFRHLPTSRSARWDLAPKVYKCHMGPGVSL
jgi:hypothetical protein